MTVGIPAEAAAVPVTWYGALQARPDQASSLAAIGARAVTLEIGWNAAEPQPDRFDAGYLARQRAIALRWQRSGFRVILDTGLQYPPSWAATVPGAAPLENQFGQVWTGSVGSHLVDSVFSPAVRVAEQRYYAQLGAAFAGVGLAGVRVGGLHMGELSYPPAVTGSRDLWMYSSSAQAHSPVPGWRPGSGTPAQARAALSYYFASLNSYARWLLQMSAHTFPTADLMMLLPSWGIRPGQVGDALADGMRGRTPAEQNALITQGLDWSDQVALLVPYGRRGIAYTTWLDAPDSGPGVRDISPVAYLHGLTGPLHVGLAGENSGGGGRAAMDLALGRARAFALRGVLWMNAADLLADHAAAKSFARAARRL